MPRLCDLADQTTLPPATTASAKAGESAPEGLRDMDAWRTWSRLLLPGRRERLPASATPYSLLWLSLGLMTIIWFFNLWGRALPTLHVYWGSGFWPR
jgi:hypothetical protein